MLFFVAAPVLAATNTIVLTDKSGIVSTNYPLQIGSHVKTTAALNVRNEPNLKSGKILCTQPSGALGTIIGGPVEQQGYTWWYLNFDASCDGYSVQDYLELVPAEGQVLGVAVPFTLEGATMSQNLPAVDPRIQQSLHTRTTVPVIVTLRTASDRY